MSSSKHKLRLASAFAALAALALAVSCTGFFQNPTLTSISISPSAPMVELGQTTTLQAFGSYDDGSRNQITSGLSWSSSDPTIASIGTTSGVLSGVQTGSVTITADAQGLSSTATATVFIVVSAMSIEPTNPSMPSSGTQAFTVYGTVSGTQTNISSGATVVVEQAGATVTTITCSYDSTNNDQLCTSTAANPGSYEVVATYTGSTLEATTGLTVTP